jgi:hypothetical protein
VTKEEIIKFENEMADLFIEGESPAPIHLPKLNKLQLIQFEHEMADLFKE